MRSEEKLIDPVGRVKYAILTLVGSFVDEARQGKLGFIKDTYIFLMIKNVVF